VKAKIKSCSHLFCGRNTSQDPSSYAEKVQKSTFSGETFRVLKEKELRLYSEYRTRRLVLEAWEEITWRRRVL